MGELQSNSLYREKAAVLHAAAARTPNPSIRFALLKAAAGYERLAEFAGEQPNATAMKVPT